ncbi:NYN domain-containing protein [Pontiella agarivorans]|uniref:NYN domain-containing protein n=1 Tax=Pontiella agarivorans TaxID=3038953 RepID=A0ABU5MU24_9BACT|nr:NYN domain-containing protein [Pontiella agarivorans]MDZ8117461.1 NYN domain-containing protein [Pontiella agarivorans]
MRLEWLIIDGYNLLHKVEELSVLLHRDMELARHKLVRMLEATAHRMAPQTTIVFDGREQGQDAALTSKHLEIFFSPGKHTADTVIERLVAKFPTPGKILVVTSDRAEADTVLSDGAQVMSCSEFLAQCNADARKTTGKQIRPGQNPKLGDLFPDGM